MKSNHRVVFLVVMGVAWLWSANQSLAQEKVIVLVRTLEGDEVFGELEKPLELEFSSSNQPVPQRVPLAKLLSFRAGLAPSGIEQATIDRLVPQLKSDKLNESAEAASALGDIGIPVISALLKNFEDTDGHEPDARYRLFGRILPGHVDSLDRSSGLIRLDNGESVRGNLISPSIFVVDARGNRREIQNRELRSLAVRRSEISKSFDLQALHHCTYVGWMDCGIIVSNESKLTIDAVGFVRLSFDEDGWSADPDGILEPLAGKRKLQEGFRWGSVLGRIGVSGERWFAGKHLEKQNLGSGRLQVVINDNEHWQNNIGSFRVKLIVTNAFDVDDPQ